jgi:hypothetical protein
MEAIKPFDWQELHNKTLKIFIGTDWSNGVDYTCKTIIGKDIETGKIIFLNQEVIRSDNQLG